MLTTASGAGRSDSQATHEGRGAADPRERGEATFGTARQTAAERHQEATSW